MVLRIHVEILKRVRHETIAVINAKSSIKTINTTEKIEIAMVTFAQSDIHRYSKN